LKDESPDDFRVAVFLWAHYSSIHFSFDVHVGFETEETVGMIAEIISEKGIDCVVADRAAVLWLSIAY
jgi:hypothetical protein